MDFFAEISDLMKGLSRLNVIRCSSSRWNLAVIPLIPAVLETPHGCQEREPTVV
jgi:hypothetical protein